MNSIDSEKGNSLDPLLLGAGKILFLFQQLESTLELCCAFLKIQGIQITVDNLFSDESNKRSYTLGQMISGMKKSMGFKASFEQRLGEFVKMRNTFIHDYWVKNDIHALDELVNQVAYQKIAVYEMELYDETIYIMQVFIGLHYAIGAEIASRENKLEELESNSEYDVMKQFLPQFLAVVETT